MRLLWLLAGCALCACLGCSPRPGSSFGFLDGKPIHSLREADRETCLAVAEKRCRGPFEVLEERPLTRHSGGWVDPERHRIEDGHYMRVKCENH